MRKVIYLLSVVLLLGGCRSKSHEIANDNSELIEIPSVIAESVMDIATNYHYITLNVADNMDAALGAISKLRVFRDKIYVMDNSFTNKLLIFGTDGTFLKKVSRMGRGPSEYLDIDTFDLDYTRNELLLKENAGNRIHIFDLDGNYKRTISNNIYGGGIAILKSGKIVHGAELFRTNDDILDGAKLIICDNDNRPIEWYCQDRANYPFGFGSPTFLNPGVDGSATFAPQFSGEVYRISDEGVERIYVIDFDNMLNPRELLKYDAMEFEKSPLSRQTIFKGNHADSEECFHFTYEHNKKKYNNVYYDKKSKSAVLSDDILCGKNLTFDEHGNIWGALTEAALFYEESEKAVELKSAIAKSGNPIVISYNLKKL
jgi:hypothetical protein